MCVCVCVCVGVRSSYDQLPGYQWLRQTERDALTPSASFISSLFRRHTTAANNPVAETQRGRLEQAVE